MTIAYRLYDEQGELHAEVTRGEPLRFVHGYAQVIPGLELGLEGARAGDRRSLTLEPEDAFGERDPDALLEIDRRDFPEAEGATIDDELVCIAPDGSECTYRIVSLGESEIVADRNHPLAGKRVRFDVEVLAVRRASEEELAAAEAQMEELIVYAESIGYQTELDTGPDDHMAAEPLVQLRVNPKTGPTR